jgi:hypothetical protein
MGIDLLKYPLQSPHDRVLWEPANHGGMMTKSDLAHRVQMRLSELDAILWELEHSRKIKLTEIKGMLVVGLRRN